MSTKDFTKKEIGSTFKKMVRKSSFQKVTVTNLCAEAGISRTCFYNHFKDTYDVVNWLFNDEFLSKYDIEPNTYFFDGLFLDFCKFCYNDSLYYSKILSLTSQNSFRQYLSDSIKPIAFEDVKKGINNDILAEMFIDFIVDHIMFSIPRWLNNPNQISPQLFVEQLLALFANAAYTFGDYVSMSAHLNKNDE